MNNLTKDLVLQFSGQIIGRIFFYLFLIYTARVLGVEEYGAFSYALNLCYLAYAIMDFGLDTLSIKAVSRGETERFSYFIVTRVITTVCMWILMLMIGMFYEHKIFYSILILCTGFAFFSILNILCSYFRATQRMDLDALVLVSQRGVLLLFGIIILSTWKSSLATSAAFSLSILIICIWTIYIYIKQNPTNNFRWEKKRSFRKIRNILQEAIPLAIAGCVWTIYYRIDTIMIANFRSMAEVGNYNAAYRLIEGVVLIPRIIMIVVFPRITQLSQTEDKTFYLFFIKLLIALFVIAFIVSSILFGASSSIMNFIYGHQYQDSIAIFQILLLSAFIMYPAYLLTHVLIAIDKQKLYMHTVIVATVVNIGLNAILIPEYGASGAAWATVFTDYAITIASGCILVMNYRANSNQLQERYK